MPRDAESKGSSCTCAGQFLHMRRALAGGVGFSLGIKGQCASGQGPWRCLRTAYMRGMRNQNGVSAAGVLRAMPGGPGFGRYLSTAHSRARPLGGLSVEAASKALLLIFDCGSFAECRSQVMLAWGWPCTLPSCRPWSISLRVRRRTLNGRFLLDCSAPN